MRLILLVFLGVISAASYSKALPLKDLQALDSSTTLASMSPIRSALPDDPSMKMTAMRDTALATGAQHGYAHRIGRLKEEIRNQSSALDRLYDFGALMRLASTGESEMYLLPPVIQIAEDVMAVEPGSRRARVSDSLIKIMEPARLVTRPPDWREYLVFDVDRTPSIPHKVLLPSTREERRYWSSWVVEGWKAGVVQAEMEMAARVRKLINTYMGMTRYIRLSLERKVDAPQVTSLKQDVTGGGDEMRIDDRVYELTVDARMNTNKDLWRALTLDSRDSLLTKDEAKAIDKEAIEKREAPSESEDDHITVFGSGE